MRQVGRWTPERGVELTRAPEEGGAGAAVAPAAPSYTLEPWSQARRLRMIHEAQRSAAAAATAAHESVSVLWLNWCVPREVRLTDASDPRAGGRPASPTAWTR